AEAASQHYFGHSAAKLSRSEAAQLAATLPSPLKRNPQHRTPYFRRQANTIEQRFKWGVVNVDMPMSERREKYTDRETLLDFIFWRMKQ
ncbi:transglycosylase domain-containing protein, partial [Vibrio sp. FNV 38]|nr:transglycosylase domain-containing protein [Vibrio sp. FNV 38]